MVIRWQKSQICKPKEWCASNTRAECLIRVCFSSSNFFGRHIFATLNEILSLCVRVCSAHKLRKGKFIISENSFAVEVAI